MSILSASHNRPAVLSLGNTLCDNAPVTITKASTGIGQLPAHRAVGQRLLTPPANQDLTQLLALLGTLVNSLKTLMAKDNSLPTPAPDTAPSKESTWRNTLAPFMTRTDLARTRTSFDTELLEMFAGDHDEPATGFLSAKTKGQIPDDIANGLRATYEPYPYQGQTGREEHVGAIKVAMMAFGQNPAGIFDAVAKVTGGYNITMKDGFKLHITAEELSLATKAAKFSGGDDGMVKDACFLFGVMSKRKSLEQDLEKQSDPFMSLYGKDSSYHAYRTYPGVLATAAEGIEGDKALGYLGLKAHTRIVEAHALGSQAGVPLDKGDRHKNGVIIGGVMEGQLSNTPVSPSLKVVTLERLTTTEHQPVNPGRFIRGTVADTGIKPADVFRDFYQQTEGNCVTISAIKAAMMRFGHNPHGIYKTLQATDTGYRIVMRDGFKLEITHDELEQARSASDFRAERPNDVLVNAQFLYAVSAKRAQLENNDGFAREGFSAALRSLNDGEYPGQALRRLGLKDHVAPATLQDFRQGAVGTIADAFHSMAVINGMADVYGQKTELRDSDWSGTGIGLKLL